MANAGNGRSQSAVPSANHDDSDVIDVCSDSSSDKAARLAGSPSVDSDATLSDASDAGLAVKGCRLLLECHSCIVREMLGPIVAQMQSSQRLCRSWNLRVCLLMVRGCIHARGARIAAKLYRSTKYMSAYTLVRNRSSAASARTLQVKLAS